MSGNDNPESPRKQIRVHEIFPGMQVIVPGLFRVKITGINIFPVFLVNSRQYLRGENPVGIALIRQKFIRINSRKMLVHFASANNLRAISKAFPGSPAYRYTLAFNANTA